MANRFTAGNRAIAECDRCGIRVKLKDLKKLVIKTKQIELKVCHECWEPDQPQLQLGMYPVSDPQAVRDPRPDFAEYPASRAKIVPVQNFLNSEEYTSAGGAIGTVTFSIPAPPPVACDPYFAAVTLLLNFDGGYTDSSSSGNTVNNSGCSITASPVKFGSGALQTNGTSPGGGGANNISTALSSQFGICSGDFTIECFAYLKTSVSAVYSTIFRLENGLGVTALRYSVKTGSDVETSVIDAGGSLVTFATTTDPFTLNTWHHVAITRSGTTVYIFLDGVVLSASTISVPTAQGLKVIIGNQSAPGSTGWDGYIDEFRITRSFARYTANFTPPTEAFPNVACPAIDPYYANVSLLLHMDGSNGSTTFTDNSPSPKTVTANGNAQVNTSVVKYGTGSVSFPTFNGLTDYLSIPSSPAFGFGNGEFTIEAWLYIISYTGSTYTAIVDIRNTPSGNGAVLFYYDPVGRLGYYSNSNLGTSTPVALNTWTHVALVRDATTAVTIYLNGVAQNSVNDGTNKSNNQCYIGRVYDAAHRQIHGYIDDLRITKGVARYLANFTPPTAPFPNA